MKDIEFIEDTSDGKQIFRLPNGTTYLPSIYIQNNEHWNRWMVFDLTSNEAITNRTFQNKEDCINFVATYDEQSESTLNMLQKEVKSACIQEQLKQIDFVHPKQVTPITSDDGLDLVVYAQKTNIAEIYKLDVRAIKLISTYFDGLLSLYVKDTESQDERIFYIYNNGNVSEYQSWKAVSVMMALCNKLTSYTDIASKYQRLDDLLNKPILDTLGNGFIFEKHIKDTNLIYAQKIHVSEINGVPVAQPSLPLTPVFICEVDLQAEHIELTMVNHFATSSEEQKHIITYETA